MDFEKRYKEALERARKEWSNNLDGAYKNYRERLEIIFPELKESDDEKIREEIISALKWANHKGVYNKHLAWLEKQEQEKHLSEPIKDYQGCFTCWNNAHDFKPKHLQRCICYDKYMNGVYCYVYDDISKYWCTQTTEEHDPDGDNHICDYADYRVTVWMPLPNTSFYPSKSWLEKQGISYTKKDVDDAYLRGISDAKNEIEKQHEANYQIRKDIATFIFNYRGDIKDRAKWMDYLDIKVSFIDKQDEKEINNFDVLPGLYKCVHRMFDETPDGRLLFEVGNIYKCLSKHDRAEFEVSYGHSIYLEDPVVRKHFIPFNKVEPKFHEGDWIVQNDNGTVSQIFEVINGIDEYGEYHAYNHTNGYFHACFENNYHLWTIQDAKDGDILYAKGSYFKEYVFKFSSFTEDNVISTHFGYDIFHGAFDTKLSRFGREEDFVSITPATKNQRELLLQKMKEAGYEWNIEKKELIKKYSENMKGN